MDGACVATQTLRPTQGDEGGLDSIVARRNIAALGGMLYTLPPVNPPIKGRTAQEAIANVRSGAIEPPSHIKQVPHCPDGRIPDSLAAVAMKALSRARMDRYQTVTDLQKDIEAYQTGFATTAERASVWRQ